MTVPFGMGSEFGDGWEGAERGISSEMYTVDFNPNLAWKITDKVTFGAGVSVQYANAKMKTRVKLGNTAAGQNPATKRYLTQVAGDLGTAALREGLTSEKGQTALAAVGKLRTVSEETVTSEIKADSIAWGFNVGLMWQPAENFRVAVSYRSEVSHDAEGDLTTDADAGLLSALQTIAAGLQANNLGGHLAAISQTFGSVAGTHDGAASISAPAWAMVSAAWDVSDLLSVYATFRWTDWSSFRELKIKSGGSTQTTIDNNWKDTYLGSVGADLRLYDWWTLRGGVGNESSPISNPRCRLGVIPDADRWWFAVGSSFKLSENLQTDVSFAHLHGVHERSLYESSESGSERLGWFRKLDAYLFGAQMVYRF